MDVEPEVKIIHAVSFALISALQALISLENIILSLTSLNQIHLTLSLHNLFIVVILSSYIIHSISQCSTTFLSSHVFH